ncbi:DUF4136 domain-containing protein [Gelidibacter salicanalis]|uniref:DUF4136 domain-containing protein n=1 Tax=Gelidibacter salicanalis TaxID=291193 RepID=A0A934NJT3_9FLAO|nr:DUF4136 domain-containing protein [Gelidibacter salicanalis]MBJ7881879.1 DUF4136 domain-containing protein [Gelidibacter salicanalis]
MKKGLLLLVLSLVVFSCATVRVNYDYESATDFGTYKTYNYYETMDTGMSELDSKRLLDALDSGLQAQGLSLSDAPDFLINIQSSQYQEAQRNNVGVGVGGSGRNVGGGVSIGLPVGQAKINREIVFEFVDETKSGLFWQAISTSKYNVTATPEAREIQFKAIVAKVLSGYPPRSKK